MFLAGRFPKVEREKIQVVTKEYKGRLDFKVDGIGIELAVRKSSAPQSSLLPQVNNSEISKLLKFKGKSLLVLLDYSSSPLHEIELDAYREYQISGKGNHKPSPYNLIYIYIDGDDCASIKKNIRV